MTDLVKTARPPFQNNPVNTPKELVDEFCRWSEYYSYDNMDFVQFKEISKRRLEIMVSELIDKIMKRSL